MEELNPPPKFVVSRLDNGIYLDYPNEKEGLVPFVLRLHGWTPCYPRLGRESISQGSCCLAQQPTCVSAPAYR